MKELQRSILGGALMAAGIIGFLWTLPTLLKATYALQTRNLELLQSKPLLQAHFLFITTCFLVMLVLGAFLLALEDDNYHDAKGWRTRREN